MQVYEIRPNVFTAHSEVEESTTPVIADLIVVHTNEDELGIKLEQEC